MKLFKIKTRVIFFLGVIPVISACSSLSPKGSAVEPDSCKNVPKLSWQVYEEGATAEDAVKLASELVAAGKIDAGLSNEYSKSSGEASVSLTSELSKIVRSNVKKKSDVSQRFWEQDLTFRQSVCYLDTLSLRDDLTKEQKNKVVDEILSFSSVRKNYMFSIEKKSGTNQH